MTQRAPRSRARRPGSTRSPEHAGKLDRAGLDIAEPDHAKPDQAAPGHAEPGRSALDRQPADPDGLARALCLRQLEARSRTRVELQRYLARKLVPEDSAARVLDRFAEIGLIDDESLARAFTSSRHAEQGLARRAIAIKLKQRGVDDDVIATAVASVDSDDEVLAAQRLVAKRLPAVAKFDRTVQTRRLVGLLGRKGYPPGLAYRVVREAMADLGSAAVDEYEESETGALT